MKKLLTVLVAGAILVACSNNEKSTSSTEVVASAPVAVAASAPVTEASIAPEASAAK